MSKNLKKDEWLRVIETYRKNGTWEAEKQYRKITDNFQIKGRELRARIRLKSKMLDNIGMTIFETKTRNKQGRPRKRDDSDIPSIIDKLNDEQKREIIEGWIRDQRDKQDKKEINKYKTLSVALKSEITLLHRTTFYKKQKKERIYKFDIFRERVEEIFNDSKGIYGSRKISISLQKEGIDFNDRTLRNYMNRWNLVTKTRVPKRKREQKQTNVKFDNLVKRNFNPKEDNIIATDVSYIPANEEQNNVYLSIAISHKTKAVESFEVGLTNGVSLVKKTIMNIKRNNFILHSDHGFQYSHNEILDLNNTKQIITSMSRIGNSLDNREAEYFFSCLKGEYLNYISTRKMKLEEIKEHIAWYIKWYNTNRIQKRLQWKTPTEVSAYAI